MGVVGCGVLVDGWGVLVAGRGVLVDGSEVLVGAEVVAGGGVVGTGVVAAGVVGTTVVGGGGVAVGATVVAGGGDAVGAVVSVATIVGGGDCGGLGDAFVFASDVVVKVGVGVTKAMRLSSDSVIILVGTRVESYAIAVAIPSASSTAIKKLSSTS